MHRRILAVLASLAFIVAACGGDDDGGGEGAEGDGQMRRVAENIFERLVDRDLDNPEELAPRLAESLPENIDDTTWEVKIREGVEFTNGEPFNAEVAAAAILREIDP